MRKIGFLMILAAVLCFFSAMVLPEMLFPCEETGPFACIGGPANEMIGVTMMVSLILALLGVILVAWDFLAKKQNSARRDISAPNEIRQPVLDTAEPIEDDEISKISKLSELHKAGAISDTEFERKKAELLDRL